MSLPVISVIVPSYNHGAFLTERIESILNQSFQDFELIILDDCSKDNSRSIIDKYADNPKVVSIIYNDENSGSTFPQWSKGLAMARCEWIWIAESDDVSDLNFLQHLYSLAIANPQATLVYCRTMQIDENGKHVLLNLWADGLDKNRWNKPFETSGKEEIEHFFIYRCVIPNASSAIFKKKNSVEILTKVLSAKMKFSGDWFFWGHILNDGYVVYSPEMLNFQRFHSQTTRHLKSEQGEIDRIKESIYCIEEIAKSIGHEVNWFDKRYLWLYEYCQTRVSFGKKFQAIFFKIPTQKIFVANAIFFDIKTFFSSSLLKLRRVASRIFRKFYPRK